MFIALEIGQPNGCFENLFRFSSTLEYTQMIALPHWLTPPEKTEVLRKAHQFALLRWSNKRDLPLKSGGKTDVYANLRDCRKTAGATSFLAEYFAGPMRRMGIEQLVEMPSAMSGVAGVLAEMLGIPYVTIRDNPKGGRVGDAEIIGELRPGLKTAMFDDVMTDGATKVPAFRLCKQRGVEPEVLVVLVDRQQGWQETFRREGIDMLVWPGMDLHDVRSFLVTTGLMQRCDPQTEKLNPFILALDGQTWETSLSIADRMRPSGAILKVNDLLITRGMNRAIEDLSVYGRVMADPKWHDTPTTVGNYCRQLIETPPWAVTVHASGGSEMVQAAAIELAERTILLAITVLTSLDKECLTIYHRTPEKQVQGLARLAWKAGAKGFVCSAYEVAMLRREYPEAVIVVPGLKSPGAAVLKGQARVGTFEDAKKDGANFFVGGRQFLGNADPIAEMQRVLKEELAVTF